MKNSARRARYAANLDAERARGRAYAANREGKAAYYQANKDRVKTRYADYRDRAIAIYGGRCTRCGSTDRLEFDHEESDGEEHRKIESHLTLYRRIALLGSPITDYRLRLLCAPCHRSRSRLGTQNGRLGARGGWS